MIRPVAPMMLLALAAGCTDLVVTLPLYPEAERIEPLPEYEGWYEAVEECVGEDGDFEAVQWHSIPEFPHHQQVGEWVAPDDIYLREDALENEGAVRHESLHHILYVAGIEDEDHEHWSWDECAPVWVSMD